MLKPFNPKRMGIFGLYARSKENIGDSDIDILYSFKNAIGLFGLVSIKENLEKRLEKIDLVSEISIKLKILISNNLRVIYKH